MNIARGVRFRNFGRHRNEELEEEKYLAMCVVEELHIGIEDDRNKWK